MTQQINRRTVTKGIAWSVPAVALASAAPAFASSGPAPTITLGTACKSPGNSCKAFPKGYRVPARICNPGKEDVWIYTFAFTTDSSLSLTLSNPSLPIQIPAGQCQDILLETNANNSGNHTFTLRSESKWGHTPTAGTDENQAEHDANPMRGEVYVPGTPPDCACTAYGETPVGAPATPSGTEDDTIASNSEPVGETATPAVEEAPAEAVVDDAPAAEATVVETGEPLVEADVQEPVVEAEVVEETN